MSTNYFNPFFSVKIMDGLFICNQTAVKDQQFVSNNKFTLIINTCPRQFKVTPLPSNYKVCNFFWVNSKNQVIQPINIDTFKSIFNQITTNLQQGYGTLIVSDRGHSRAITFVLFYLMDKFGWQLFKALQYINSKKENLSVRATYLKILLNYQKSHKQPALNNTQMKELQNNNIPSYFQSSTTNAQNWSVQNITSPLQTLITNTFKNTSKKRRLNDINLQYRDKINNKISVQKQRQRRISYNMINQNKRYDNVDSKRMINGHVDKKALNKTVKFSDQIQVISGQSIVSHNFPQYSRLSPSKISSQQLTMIKNQPNSTNSSRLLSMRKVGQKTPHQRRKQTTKQIICLDRQQLYCDNLLSYPDAKQSAVTETRDDAVNIGHQQQQKNIQQIGVGKYVNQSHSLQLKSLGVGNQDRDGLDDKTTQMKMGLVDDEGLIKSTMATNQQPKSKLSSYKKLKAALIQKQIQSRFLPQKTQQQEHKQKLKTQPQCDLYETADYVPINHGKIKNNNNISERRRMSSTVENYRGNKLVMGHSQQQQRNSLSSAIGSQKMNNNINVERSSESVIKKQKQKQQRCYTPQLTVSSTLLINNQSISSHGNIMSRPLSRQHSSSVRGSRKLGAEYKQKKSKNKTTEKNIFNMNINFNIGRFQILENTNFIQDNIITKTDTHNNQSQQQLQLFENLSQQDKMILVKYRPRSNSSNQNYSRLSSLLTNQRNHSKSSASEFYKKKVCRQKQQATAFIRHNRPSLGSDKGLIQKADSRSLKMNKELSKFSKEQSVKFSKEQLLLRSSYKEKIVSQAVPNRSIFSSKSSFYQNDQLNMNSSGHFTKQQLVNKINKKLINNNNNSNSNKMNI